MNRFDVFENFAVVSLSESNRHIIGQALRDYKNIAVFSNETDEYLEIQELEIDEILQVIGE